MKSVTNSISGISLELQTNQSGSKTVSPNPAISKISRSAQKSLESHEQESKEGSDFLRNWQKKIARVNDEFKREKAEKFLANRLRIIPGLTETLRIQAITDKEKDEKIGVSQQKKSNELHLEEVESSSNTVCKLSLTTYIPYGLLDSKDRFEKLFENSVIKLKNYGNKFVVLKVQLFDGKGGDSSIFLKAIEICDKIIPLLNYNAKSKEEFRTNLEKSFGEINSYKESLEKELELNEKSETESISEILEAVNDVKAILDQISDFEKILAQPRMTALYKIEDLRQLLRIWMEFYPDLNISEVMLKILQTPNSYTEASSVDNLCSTIIKDPAIAARLKARISRLDKYISSLEFLSPYKDDGHKRSKELRSNAIRIIEDAVQEQSNFILRRKLDAYYAFILKFDQDILQQLSELEEEVGKEVDLDPTMLSVIKRFLAECKINFSLSKLQKKYAKEIRTIFMVLDKDEHAEITDNPTYRKFNNILDLLANPFAGIREYDNGIDYIPLRDIFFEGRSKFPKYKYVEELAHRIEITSPSISLDFAFKVGIGNVRELLLPTLLPSLGDLGKYILPKFYLPMQTRAKGSLKVGGIVSRWLDDKVDLKAWSNYNQSTLGILRAELMGGSSTSYRETQDEAVTILCTIEAQESLMRTGILDMLLGNIDSHSKQYMKEYGYYYHLDFANFLLPDFVYKVQNADGSVDVFAPLRSFAISHPIALRTLPAYLVDTVLSLDPEKIESDWKSKELVADESTLGPLGLEIRELRRILTKIQTNKTVDKVSKELTDKLRSLMIKALQSRISAIRKARELGKDALEITCGEYLKVENSNDLDEIRNSKVKLIESKIKQLEIAKDINEFVKIDKKTIEGIINSEADRKEKFCYSKVHSKALVEFKERLKSFQKYLKMKKATTNDPTLREATETVYPNLKLFWIAVARCEGNPYEDAAVEARNDTLVLRSLNRILEMAKRKPALFSSREIIEMERILNNLTVTSSFKDTNYRANAF